MSFEFAYDSSIMFNGRLIPGERISGSSFDFEGKCLLTMEKGLLRWQIREEGDYVFVFSVGSSRPHSYKVMVPGVWYDGNPCGEGLFPSSSKSPVWHFLETRMAVPAMVELYSEGYSFAASLSPAREYRELADSSWTGSSVVFRIPGKEEPYSYRGKKSLVATEKDIAPVLHLKKGDSYERGLNLLGRECGKYQLYEEFIRCYYHESCQPLPASWRRYAVGKLVRLLNLVRVEGPHAYLLMGEDNGEVDDVYRYTSASFLVKSLEAAYEFYTTGPEILLQENKELQKARERIACLLGEVNDEGLLKILALRIADSFLACESSPGCFQDCIDIRTGERGGYLGIGEHPEFRYLINARCNGEAMTSYLKLYEVSGCRRYLELARRVADFYIDNQLDNGSFGRWFSLEGKAVNSSGTNGAYIASFLVELSRFDKDPRLIRAVEKAADYYSNMALADDFYGDTLDADSIDKEAGVAILSFLLSYSEHFGLKHEAALEKAAAFVSTWIWMDDSYIDPASMLGRTGFRTRGLTSVSVAHHHLDFYGMLIAKDYMRLNRLLKNDYYLKLAALLLEGSYQLINDETLRLDRDPVHFYGYQPEQINHTRWDYFSNRANMEGHYGIDIAWVHVLGYGAFLEILRNFPSFLLL